MTLQNSDICCNESFISMTVQSPKNELSKKTKGELIELVCSLQKENNQLKNETSERYVKKLSDDEIRTCIVEHVKRFPSGTEFFPSEIATEYNLDGDDVERVMDKMLDEGYFT